MTLRTRLSRRILPIDWQRVRAQQQRNRTVRTLLLYLFWVVVFATIAVLVITSQGK